MKRAMTGMETQAKASSCYHRFEEKSP